MTYEKAIELIDQGYSFSINLRTKSVYVNKHCLILNREIMDEEFKSPFLYYGWDNAELLYENYKHSVPHEREHKSYFKALSSNELTDSELAFGDDRNVAQFILELYVLLGGPELKEKMNPDRYFFQGNDKMFVVLKDWL